MPKFDPLINYKHRGSFHYFFRLSTMVNTPPRAPDDGDPHAVGANGAGNGGGLQPPDPREGPPILDDPALVPGAGIVALAPPIGVNADNGPPNGVQNDHQLQLVQQQQLQLQANHQAQLRQQVQQVADLQAQMGFMSIQNPAHHGFLPQAFPVAEPVQIPIFSLPRSGRTPINPFNLLGLSTSLPRLPVSVPGQALQQAGVGVQAAPGQPPDGSIQISSFQVQSALTKLAMENQVLFQAKQEREVAAIVGQFSNPMSKRSVEHNMRLGHTVEELVTAITPGAQLIIAHAGNLDQVNSVLQIVGSSAQLLRDRLSCDSEKHLIAKTSSLGWKLVQSLEGLEGSLGKISMSALHTQEKAYLSHQQALSAVIKTPPAGGGGRGGYTGKGKGRGKSFDSALKGTKKGGVGKPKKGSCYRCGGSHFYRNCPHPPITPE
jgi:hypothetical protein